MLELYARALVSEASGDEGTAQLHARTRCLLEFDAPRVVVASFEPAKEGVGGLGGQEISALRSLHRRCDVGVIVRMGLPPPSFGLLRGARRHLDMIARRGPSGQKPRSARMICVNRARESRALGA